MYVNTAIVPIMCY